MSMTVTRIFLALSFAAFLVNLYVLVEARSLMRPALGDALYVWVCLLYIAGMYFISKEVALYGKRFLGRGQQLRRKPKK